MKAFGIGYNKSGTKSCHNYCEMAGLWSAHFKVTGPAIERWRQGIDREPLASVIERYDVFWDVPLNHWRDVYRTYSNEKFILTLRSDYESWQTSRILHVLKNRLNPDYNGSWTKVNMDADRILWENHPKEVVDFFGSEGIMHRLLVIDVAKGEGPLIAPFLGVSCPSDPFPRINTAEEKMERILELVCGGNKPS